MDASPPARGASRTALGVAVLRAAHQILDAPPRILEDPLAVTLLDPSITDRLETDRDRFQTPGARAWRSHVVLRSRYAEDRLENAVGRGVSQHVILGAGYDTFAYRQPAWAGALQIFEVDQPASQSAKRTALERAGIAIPPNLTMVPVDFETDSLPGRLAAAGLDSSRPTFFSWLGVMVYLPEPASDAVFQFVATAPRDSEIAFSFAPNDPDRATVRPGTVQALVESLGEPWRNFTDQGALAVKLRGFGFREVEFLTPADADARYFRGRVDGLPPPRRSSIGSAVV